MLYETRLFTEIMGVDSFVYLTISKLRCWKEYSLEQNAPAKQQN